MDGRLSVSVVVVIWQIDDLKGLSSTKIEWQTRADYQIAEITDFWEMQSRDERGEQMTFEIWVQYIIVAAVVHLQHIFLSSVS